MSTSTLVIIHDSDGKECYVSNYVCHGREPTNLEKWLLHLDKEEATKLLVYIFNKEDIEEMQTLLAKIKENEEMKNSFSLKESFLGEWTKNDDISVYTKTNHCQVFIRYMTCS